MNADKYLRGYIKENDRQRRLKKRRAELKSRLYTIKTSSAGDVINGGIKNEAIINLIDKIQEIEQEMSLQEMKAVSKQWEIGQEVNKLDYPYCAILSKYYLERKTLEKIAVEMHISYRTVLRHKRNGLKKFSELESWHTMSQ